MAKYQERERAIVLRRGGSTYSQILAEIPIAKSTLAIWLRAAGLAEENEQKITLKRREAAFRGAQARRTMRLAEVSFHIEQGILDIQNISTRELWLIGVALYWAEGSKQNQRSPSAGVDFINSDYRMLLVFLEWLRYLGIPERQIRFELYVHENRQVEIHDFRRWWADKLNLRPTRIDRIYLKKGNPKTNRTNVADLYHGLLRIKVRSSTTLNRKISGWIAGIVAHLGSGVTGNTSAFEAEDSRIVP